MEFCTSFRKEFTLQSMGIPWAFHGHSEAFRWFWGAFGFLAVSQSIAGVDTGSNFIRPSDPFIILIRNMKSFLECSWILEVHVRETSRILPARVSGVSCFLSGCFFSHTAVSTHADVFQVSWVRPGKFKPPTPNCLLQTVRSGA